MEKSAFVISSGDLEGKGQTGFPGFTLRSVVNPEDSISPDFRMSLITIESGKGTPRHFHRHSDEAWYIVSGSGIFYADGKKTAFKKGDFLFARRNVVHQLVNAGKGPLDYVAVTAPPCDLQNDQHVAESFDSGRHLTLAPEPA